MKAVGTIGVKLIESKLDQHASEFLQSRERVLHNAAALYASTAAHYASTVDIRPVYMLPRYTGATTGLVHFPPMCIRCSARPVVSSVGSRAAYCEQHWLELWNAGT